MNPRSTSGHSCRGCFVRSGLSLIELLAAMTLMGLFATAVASHFGRDVFGDTSSRGGARVLSLELLSAQRNAIRTGLSHGIEFVGDDNDIRMYFKYKINPGNDVVRIGEPITVPKDYRLSVNEKDVVFNFEGNGMTSFSSKFFGPNRGWTVEVSPLTRMISSNEFTP